MHIAHAMLVMMLAAPAAAQAPAESSAPTTAPSPITTQEDSSPTRPGEPRAPLLREGSTLLRVQGRVQRNEQTKTWEIRLRSDKDGAPQHVLTIMPNSIMWELEQIAGSMPDDTLFFEVTGTVFVYGAQNYLLLSHPPLLVERQPASGSPMPGMPGMHSVPGDSTYEGAEPEDDDSAPGGIIPGDTAEDIIRALEQDVGPVTQRPIPTDSAGADHRGAARQSGPGHREGDMVLQRRGGVRRSGDGSFVFVFTADADGMSDPPMILLPCLLLERIERTLDQRGEGAPLLISGLVYAYDGRNYLLPTLCRVPVERTQLSD